MSRNIEFNLFLPFLNSSVVTAPLVNVTINNIRRKYRNMSGVSSKQSTGTSYFYSTNLYFKIHSSSYFYKLTTKNDVFSLSELSKFLL